MTSNQKYLELNIIQAQTVVKSARSLFKLQGLLRWWQRKSRTLSHMRGNVIF